MSSPADVDINVQTIEEWKNKIGELIFIYDYVLEMYQKQMHGILITNLVVGSASTILIASNFGIKDDSAWSPFVKSGATLCSLVANICTGLTTILKTKNFIEQIQAYLQILQVFQSKILVTMKLSPDLAKCIEHNKDEYINILQTAPDIPYSSRMAALNNYQKFKAEHEGYVPII